MKISVVIMFLLLYTSTASAQSSEYEKNCTATVYGQTAQFSFLALKGKTLSWDMNETSENAMEYSWEICLERAKTVCKFRFGVYHFKCLLCNNSQPDKKGTISDLLSITQKSVWNDANWVQTDMKVDAEIENDNLVIRITDQKTFSQLFSDNPTIAHFTVKTPYKDLNFETKTEIKYKQ
ncbi:MAG: hypothetical protein AB1442_13570 [Nitrospirota bacterium]